METRNRLLIDQDGVLADSMGSVTRTVKQELGVELCHYDVQDYWFKDMVVQPEYLLEVMKRPRFFRELDVITGAREAINRLREQYDVVVCTAPLKGSYDAETEKREWLAEHFDTELAETAIVTEDKARVLGRVLLEDNPHIDRFAGWQPVMFHQPWNTQVTDLPRMFGWGDLNALYREMSQ